MTPLWKTILILILLGGKYSCASADVKSCPARGTLKKGVCPKESSKYVRCIDGCDGHEVISKEDCKKTPECCFVSNTCVLRKNPAQYNEAKEKRQYEKLYDHLKNKFNVTSSTQDTGARNLQLFPGFPGSIPSLSMPGNPPIFGASATTSSSCMPFPFNCPTVSLQQIITPPVDIPYCLREYCSQADPTLENDMEKCLMQPGCYFDRELHTLRRSFGHQILPRVPVCHLAIRNYKFMEKTRLAIEKLGQWNPALTECIMTQYEGDIYDSPRGCDMNDVIEHFGYFPKIAGWTGIQRKECYLINGCWSPSRGCTYPMKMSELFVKSGQIDDTARKWAASKSPRYGMPKCQNFDSTTPTKFLKSYHTCLSSGCALDPTVTDRIYYYNLWNLTNALPPQLQYLSWVDIANSNMRADNFEQSLEKYRRMSAPSQSVSLLNSFESGSNGRVVNLLSTINSANVFNPLSFNFRGSSLINSNPSLSTIFPIQLSSSLPPVIKSVGPELCPFQQVHMFNFPSLKGRFTGCCERNLCYLPPTYQSLQRSGFSNYYSNWGEWSACTRSCNGGKTSRSRQCIGQRRGHCTGVADESKPCNTHRCPEWTMWGSYIPCSVSCGGGKTFRSRKCSGRGCVGESRQEVNCKTGACPTFSTWLHWSPCSVSCGLGTRRRTRKCISGGAYKCPSEPPTMEIGCKVYCGSIVWSPWSECNINSCKTTRIPKCKFEGRDGYCQDFPQAQSKWCNKLQCYCKRYPAYSYCQSWNRAR